MIKTITNSFASLVVVHNGTYIFSDMTVEAQVKVRNNKDNVIVGKLHAIVSIKAEIDGQVVQFDLSKLCFAHRKVVANTMVAIALNP